MTLQSSCCSRGYDTIWTLQRRQQVRSDSRVSSCGFLKTSNVIQGLERAQHALLTVEFGFVLTFLDRSAVLQRSLFIVISGVPKTTKKISHELYNTSFSHFYIFSAVSSRCRVKLPPLKQQQQHVFELEANTALSQFQWFVS